MTSGNTNRFNIFNYLWLLIFPLSYNFWGTDPALYHKFFLIDISLLVVVAMLFTGKKELPALNRQTAIFLGLYTVSIFMALTGIFEYHINDADGWFVWLHLLVFPAFVLVLLLTGNTIAANRKKISEIICWLAAISVAISIAQYISEILSSHWSFVASDAIKATYAHKNIFAEIMLLTLPFTFYAFAVTRKKWYAVIMAATAIMIGLSLSRAVVAGILVAALITTLVYTAANFKQRLRWYHLSTVLFLIVALTGAGYEFIGHTGTGKHIASFYNYRNTVHERLNLWRATMQLIKTYPFFGTGLGGWKILSMQFSMLGLRNYITFFQQPHNDFLWIISEQGFISFFFLAGAWLYLLVLLLRHIFRKPKEIFNYCLLFALTGYFVYSNFGFPRERAEHGIFLAFIAAFILQDEASVSKIILPRFSGFPLGLLLILAAWWAGNKVMCQVYMRQALECREIQDEQGEFENLKKINATYYTLDGTATPVAWYLGMIYYAQHKNAAAMAEFQQAVKYNPYHAYSLANVGTCLSAAGDKEGAEDYFRKALTYSQGFPDAALNMCALKFNKGETDSAAWYLSMARDTITDARYVKFLNVLTTALLKPMMDSAALYSETPLTENYNNLLSHPQWQMDLFKRAYTYKRPVQQQIWMDILWVLKYQGKRTEIVDKYQKSLHLPEI